MRYRSALILKNCGFESVKAVFDADGGVSAELKGYGGKPPTAITNFLLH